MSQIIELHAAPVNLRVSKGEHTESIVNLRNRGQTVDQFTLSVEGISPEWFTLPVSSVALFPSDQDKIKIIIHIPEEIDLKDTSYILKVKVTSQENPAEFATTDLNLQIDVTPNLSLALSPSQFSGNKGKYQVIVNNPGNNDANVVLKAESTHRRLSFSIQPETLMLPAGKQATAVIQARLSGLAFLLSEKTYDFQVYLDPVGGKFKNPIRESGELTSVPWYRILSNLKFPGLSRPPVIRTFKASTDNKRDFRLKWQVDRAKKVQLDGEDVEVKGDILVHPEEPKQYVLTAANKNGNVSKTVEVKPLPVPKIMASDKIKVSLSSTMLQMQAGTIPTILMVQIQNLSDIVDKYTLEVGGVDESWYSRSASSIALMPRTAEQVQINFVPPRKKGVRSGKYPFVVTVHSQSTTKESASAGGQLEILPNTELKMKINPYRKTATNKGTYRVNLNNVSISDANVVLEANDLDEGCRFQFKPEKFSLGAWNALEVPLIIRPKRGSVLGEIKRFDVTVTANIEETSLPLTANCEFNHKPFMKDMKPIWRVIRTIIILAIIIIAVYFILKVGGGWEALRDDPTQWLHNFINSIMSLFYK